MQQSSRPFKLRHMVVATVITLGIWIATIGVMSYEPATGTISVAAGGAKFRDHCGACHIVEKGISTHHGPNLYDFGKLAGQRKPGLTAAEYVLESILDPEAFVAPQNRRGMPRNLAKVMTPEEIRNVVAYVVSRGAPADFAEIQALEIPDVASEVETRTVSRQDMELAASVLRGRGECLQCHTLYRNAEYTVFAPGLFGVGLSDENLLRESIVDPNKVVSPYHLWVNVYLADGQVVNGKLISETDEQLVLLKRGANNALEQLTLKMDEVDTEDGVPLIVKSAASPMPTDLDKLLTENELDVLIRMIRQLN